jgi:O-antigen/teichoic acid export membrane protein
LAASVSVPARTLLRRPLTLSFGVSVAIQLLNVLTGILLARTLGPAVRGELATVVLWPAVIAAVGSLGVADAATYYAARGTIAHARLIWTTIAVTLVQSAALVGAGAIALPLVLGSKSDLVVEQSLLYLAYIPFHLLSLALMGILNGLHRFRAFHAARLLYAVSTAAALVLVAAGSELTTERIVVVYIAGTVLTAAGAAAAVFRHRRPRPEADRATGRTLVGFGVRSHASSITSLFNERLDLLVISLFLAPAKLGLYVVAVTLTSLTSLAATSVSLVAMPSVARLDGDARADAARRYLLLTVAAAAAISLPAAVFAPQLIRLFFGADFVPASTAARILLVAAVVLAAARTLEALLKGLGRPLAAASAELTGLAVTAGALAVLLPPFGITGAAVASLVAYGAVAAIALARTRHALNLPVSRLFSLR